MLKLDRQCTCPLCLEIFTDPVLLSCSHNLCYQCANSLISINSLRERQVNFTQTKFLSCPVCRGVTYIPGQSAEGLSRNLVLKNIIEEFVQPTVQTDIECQLCLEHPNQASYECIACELMACNDCASNHLSKPRFSHHKMIPISKTQTMICYDHNLDLELFCMECKMLCCVKCAQGYSSQEDQEGKFQQGHPGHTIFTRNIAEQKLADEILRQKESIPQIQQKIDFLRQATQSQFEEVEKAQVESQEQMNEVCEELMSKLQSVQERAHDQINRKYTSIRESIQLRLATFDRLQIQVQEMTNISDNLLFLQKSYELSDISCNPQQQDLAINIKYNNLIELKNMIENLITLQMPHNHEPSNSNLLYISRGSYDYFIYNFESDSSRTVNSSQIFPRWSGFTVLPDSRILVTGGKKDKDSGSMMDTFMLIPETGMVIHAPPMLYGHSSHVALLVKDQVYVCSGKSTQNHTHNVCEVFDIAQNQWREITRMQFGRTCAAGVHCSNMIYIFGGYSANVNQSVERYRIQEDVWDLLQFDLPEKLWQHACFALDDSQILIFGGEGPNDEPHRLSYIFNTESEKFYACASIPIHSNWLFFWLHVIRRDDNLYSMNREKHVLKYNIPTNTWTLLS